MLLRQSVISRKNIGQASEWAESEDREVAELARIVADIGRVHPGRKRRLPFVRDRHPDLWARMVAAGVVDDYPFDDDPYPSGEPRAFWDAVDRDDRDDDSDIPF